MSIYYNPQIVKLLHNERVEEAVRAGLANRTRSDEQVLTEALDRAPVAEECVPNSSSNPADC